MSKLDIRETLQQLESQLEKMIRNAERSAKTESMHPSRVYWGKHEQQSTLSI